MWQYSEKVGVPIRMYSQIIVGLCKVEQQLSHCSHDLSITTWRASLLIVHCSSSLDQNMKFLKSPFTVFLIVNISSRHSVHVEAYR